MARVLGIVSIALILAGGIWLALVLAPREPKLPLIPVVNSEGKAGYIDARGRPVFPFRWAATSPFKGGLAEVSRTTHEGSVFVTGVIDRSGNELIPTEWDGVMILPEHGVVYANRRNEDGPGLVHCLFRENGEILFQTEAEIRIADTGGAIRFDASGLARVPGANDLYGYLNTRGEMQIDPRFEDAEAFNEDGLAWAKPPGEGWALTDTTGAMLSDPVWQRSSQVEGRPIFGVRQNDQWGIMSYEGELIVEPAFTNESGALARYSEIRGDAPAPAADRTEAPTPVVPPKFAASHSQQSFTLWLPVPGLALVSDHGLSGIADENGNLLFSTPGDLFECAVVAEPEEQWLTSYFSAVQDYGTIAKIVDWVSVDVFGGLPYFGTSHTPCAVISPDGSLLWHSRAQPRWLLPAAPLAAGLFLAFGVLVRRVKS